MASTDSLYSENLRLRWLLVSGFLSALGIAALWLPFNPWIPLEEGSLSRALAFGIGPALLSAGVIGLGYELFLRRAQVRETLDAANLSVDLAKTGVVRVASFADIDWTEFFESNSGDIEICFSYGRTWSNTHAERVLRLASESGRRVRVTVLDPDPPDEDDIALRAYTHRFRLDSVDALCERINDSLNTWSDAAERVRDGGSRRVYLRLEGIRSMIPYTFYRSGDSMWIVMMPRRRERVGGIIPSVLCVKTGDADNSLFDWVMADMEACRRESVIRKL